MNKALYFLLGVGVGAAGAYFYLIDKFDKYAQEEIDSVKEAYRTVKEPVDKAEESEEIEEEIHITHTKPSLKELKNLRKISNDAGYKDYSTKVPKAEDPIHKPFNEDPQIIQPDEFGELGSDYEKVSLIYYADDVIAYELDDEIFENAEQTLGENYWEHFGEFEENAMYVRSDIEKTDYYISKDERTYEEVSGRNKPRVTKLEE